MLRLGFRVYGFRYPTVSEGRFFCRKNEPREKERDSTVGYPQEVDERAPCTRRGPRADAQPSSPALSPLLPYVPLRSAPPR